MRTARCLILTAALITFPIAGNAQAAISGLQLVTGGLTQPVYVTHAPGDADRLFIVEKTGRIKIWQADTGVLTTPFLNLAGTVSTSSEGGLLGLAFHPEYSTPGADGFGKFYVNATILPSPPISGVATTTHIREYSVSANPNVADATSARDVLTFHQPQHNHNGGWIGFSPNDGYLYIMSGDGGGANDLGTGHTPGIGNAQDRDNLLGAALRIDVNSTDPGLEYAIPADNPFVDASGLDEIWAYGLRNPWRASFDRHTGDLWIGDVGQDRKEEVNFQPAASPGGENYGWRLREGDEETMTPAFNPVGGPEPPDHAPPVYVYDNHRTFGSGPFNGGAVMGGYVYRGPDPDLQGTYFFADSEIKNAWTFDPADPEGTVANINSALGAAFASVGRMVSFGEDLHGNLYLADIANFTAGSGAIWRILTDNLLPGDFNADGVVGMDDYAEWRASFGSALANPAAGAGSSTADAADFVLWRKHLGASVHDGSATGVGTLAVPEPVAMVYLIQGFLLVLLAEHGGRRGRRYA